MYKLLTKRDIDGVTSMHNSAHVTMSVSRYLDRAGDFSFVEDEKQQFHFTREGFEESRTGFFNYKFICTSYYSSVTHILREF